MARHPLCDQRPGRRRLRGAARLDAVFGEESTRAEIFWAKNGSSAGRGRGARKSARLRARQLGQTVVSASSRLSRLDNRPDSAITAAQAGLAIQASQAERKRVPSLASVETTGCVRHASYGDEPKLPLARLSVPFVALFSSHAPCRAPRFAATCPLVILDI